MNAIVDKNVRTAAPRLDGRGKCIDIIAVRHIAGNRQNIVWTEYALQRTTGRIEPVAVAAADCDRRPFQQKLACCRQTDPGRAAGYNGRPALQTKIHAISRFLM